ncbi:MAG: hypothetical protein M3022_10805 [Actinomycetota bacterium]|nr:hypothetical protein [Actinomycetota bacterium]
MLIALPAAVARGAAVLCRGASLGILMLVLRLAESERFGRPTCCYRPT